MLRSLAKLIYLHRLTVFIRYNGIYMLNRSQNQIVRNVQFARGIARLQLLIDKLYKTPSTVRKKLI